VDFVSGAGLAADQLQAVLSGSARKIFGVQASAEVPASR